MLFNIFGFLYNDNSVLHLSRSNRERGSNLSLEFFFKKPWVFFFLHLPGESSCLLNEVFPGRRYEVFFFFFPFSLFSVYISMFSCFFFFLVFVVVLFDQTRNLGRLHHLWSAFTPSPFAHHCAALLASLKLVGFLDILFSKLDLASLVSFLPSCVIPPRFSVS